MYQLNRLHSSRTINVIRDIATECEMLGILLKLPSSMVSNIVWNNIAYSSPEIKCKNILEKWLEGQGDQPTWRGFIQVLRNGMGRHVLADELSRELEE